MKPPPRDITREHLLAVAAAHKFEPGEQPDIAALMVSAYIHGYRQALLDTTPEQHGESL